MNPNKVMITGGAGFIGSHLTEALLQQGKEVYVFDCIPLDKVTNLKEVCAHPNLHYYLGDLTDKDSIKKFYQKDAGIIYHLASVVGIKNYLADPLKLIDVVVVGTRHLLEIARENNTKFVYSSTSEVFGKNPHIPWDENSDRLLGPASIDRWSYSSSKAVCEHMLWGMHRQCGLPFTIVRFFNVYGPKQNPYYVVSQTIYKALRGESPLLYDDGTMTRCFTYIDDIVEGLLLIGASPKADGEDFNMGNYVETTIREAVETIVKCAGTGVKIKYFDTKKEYGKVYEDIPRRVPKVAKVKELLGWQARIQLEEGINKTLEWSRNNNWWLADGRN